jgi:anti-sigma B factor antagonist
MDIAVRQFQGTHILEVSGELDLYNAYRLREAVQGLLAQGARAFILNLKAVRFIDSSGVAALLSINAMLAGKARQLRLANISGPVRHVIELTRLGGFLPIASSELDAIESIGAAARRPVIR